MHVVILQNLAEAEFAVGLFMYMRLQGYPPDKITILTTYNGQKHLIRDVLNKRCGFNPYFGNPEKVGRPASLTNRPQKHSKCDLIIKCLYLFTGHHSGSLPRLPE